MYAEGCMHHKGPTLITSHKGITEYEILVQIFT